MSNDCRVGRSCLPNRRVGRSNCSAKPFERCESCVGRELIDQEWIDRFD